MADAILTLNAGSSSIKFALFGIDGEDLEMHLRGQIERIGIAPHLVAKGKDGTVLTERQWEEGALNHEALLGTLLDWIEGHLGDDTLTAVGHRVVHGGPDHDRPTLVDEGLLQAVERLVPLAPLHQPHNLSPIRAVAALRPGLPQVACFDTGFHHVLPATTTRIALPRKYAAEAVRRYGFHGLSYEYIARQLRKQAPELASGRVIVGHLGNGASLCAMRDGRSVDTTMGFTALDGLVMGTRCGTIDPGAILYLQQAYGMDADTVEKLLYQRSGLLGVSGISSDMRTLLASSAPEAREAIDLFVFRIAREAGALTSSLGGLDGFVFTAGVGENAPVIREAVCHRLAWLGAVLDPAANARGAGLISVANSRVALWVLPTDEEAMIARHTLEAMLAIETV